MPSKIVLTPEMLATGKVGIEMHAPDYGALRKARKLFPFEKADKGERVGYVPDDLLLAGLLISIGGAGFDRSGDLIDRLNPLMLADRQALSTLMIETFYLTKEQANNAADLARSRRMDPYDYRDIVENESPSGKFSCRFVVPTSKIQMECERRYPGIDKVGVGLEEYMLAYCLLTLNGQDLSEEKDKLGLLDNLEIADIQYATNYFIALSTIDEESRVDLKKHKAGIKAQLQKQQVVTSAAMPSATPTLS